jgi:hypothetical protein
MSSPNQVVCPECGRVRMETPPGTTALATIGMARKASGAAGRCDCGKVPGRHSDGSERSALAAGEDQGAHDGDGVQQDHSG